MTAERKCLLAPGTILNDKWMIMDLIGKGAMGEVYRAHQLNLQRDVAIKIVSREWLRTAEEEGLEIEPIIQRFRREFQAMAQVRHPNALQIYDYGTCSILKDEKEVDVEFIVMEYIPGATLRFTMSDEGFEPDEKLIKDWIIEYFFPVLEGVQALHTLGIVHRDLKPENVLLDGTIPKITDFGLARSTRLKPLSQTVDSQGTLTYMPPEQFVDFKRVDQRGDIFSLGRILYEAIAGKISKETIPFKTVKLANPNTPFLEKLDKIIQWSTAEEREQRLDSVEKMGQLLKEAIQELEAESNKPDITAFPAAGPWWAHPQWIWIGIALVLVTVLGMTFWHLFGNPGQTDRSAKEGKPAPQAVESPPASSSVQGLPKSIVGEDGMTMVLISGGSMPAVSGVSNGSIRSGQMKPFYMDETKVTFQQYVEFLNIEKKNLKIENGLLKSKGQVWYLIGEANENYNQIIFEHGRFHVRDPQKASQPVVRVTWGGAAAYAKYFRKRLPTELEWEYAASLNRPKGISPSSGPSNKEIEIKDLYGKINEWAIREMDFQEMGRTALTKKPSPIIFLGLSTSQGKLLRRPSFPWEGHWDVGFRCVLDITENEKVEKKVLTEKK